MVRGIGSVAPKFRSLLENHVRVRSTNAESADACASWEISRLPIGQLVIDIKRAVGEIDARVRFLEMQCGGQHAIANRECCLDQSCYSRCGVQMPDICLGRSDRAKLLPVGPRTERLSECCNF